VPWRGYDLIVRVDASVQQAAKQGQARSALAALYELLFIKATLFIWVVKRSEADQVKRVAGGFP